MKFLFFALVALFCYTGAVAQKAPLVTVKAGSNIMDVLPTAEVFYFPQFTSGKVFLRDGTVATAKLNYNRLVDEMHFISPKGDTLALDNEKDIKHIAIGDNTFYYDGGYVRLLSAGNHVLLAVKEVWVIKDAKRIGAMGSTNGSVAITSFSSYNEGGRLYDLITNEDIVLTKVKHYYFGDGYNRFVLASKKNLMTLFPKEHRRLETYLKANKVDFTNKDDVGKVAQFLEQVQ